ncbi:hypothetical protein [Pedobacter sp. MW01-1-1]|uniref:hypothetical protein n=1 Tax=Pedobacter sp. MW01-1-1 TaxID=3383027 RepID=UPI003FF0504F
MINKIIFCKLMIILSFTSAFAQKKIKPDLYLMFQIDSSKRIYKINVKSVASAKLDNKPIPEKDYDIYTYSYISYDGKTERIYKLFSSIDKHNYRITDSSFFKKQKVFPYRNLEKIKGLISEEWDAKNFAFDKVFLLEKIAENKFKIVQVELYFPFDSHGFLSRPVNSKEIIEIP